MQLTIRESKLAFQIWKAVYWLLFFEPPMQLASQIWGSGCGGSQNADAAVTQKKSSRSGKSECGGAEAKLPHLSTGEGSRILLPPSREGGNKGRPDSGRLRWAPSQDGKLLDDFVQKFYKAEDSQAYSFVRL